MTLDPNANPGRRLYEQARKAQRIKRAQAIRRGASDPVVIQLPEKKEGE